ncbi:uncharacterized protein K452DRAFT_315396 [Aplosporella prunicola CBS 121167]|uniref:WW domain-containing protein n=1 Tax=Aplosporella prunicola CBS 121167 TaxID=1176127 RepID=A0A6A6BPX7_9PEZI|nr:uncharacterized protein K452DRAFT_315396 [Aplosporella prunicola CBS 121167]KAF2146146.1 hypothetical protein K452DRAFT_315396 [Aplosporella prunicola CBS 121167]
MADYAPPPGPPPPKVPEGWVAQWNGQYKEWFYVNTYTKKSQWERPTEPVYPPGESPISAPDGPPPSYSQGAARPAPTEKGGYLSSNNPYGPGASGGSSSHSIAEDERLARQLQAEEDARAQGRPTSRGAADGYYNQGGAPGYGQPSPYGQQSQSPAQGYPQQLPPRDDKGKSKGGFLGKLLGKAGGSQQHYGQQYPHQQPQYQQQYYSGPPQGQYGYAPQQGYYGQGGGYGQPQYIQQRPQKSGGLGAGGAAALGVGGGLLGGMLLADAIEDHDEHEYDQGYQQGYDDGNDGGGDFGGGDDFGGDF